MIEHQGVALFRDPYNQKCLIVTGKETDSNLPFDVTGILLWSYERKAHGGARRKAVAAVWRDERKFKEVIHTIKGAEKDKDKFCKAARIERQPMSNEQLKNDFRVWAYCAGNDSDILILLYAVYLRR